MAVKPASASKEGRASRGAGELQASRAAATDRSSQGTKSSVSTEDEWEKVSENENEKDK